MVRRSLSLKIVLLAVMLMAAACAPGPALKGEVYPSIAPAAAIDLTDHNGQPFHLSDHRGQVVLVFFGFTNCITECPITMAILKQALETPGIAAGDVEVVMVSTNPESDTPASMKEFMQHFNPAFLGLLGSPADLAKTWQAYGVTVLDDGETHSSLTYVVDKRGDLRETFSPESAPAEIASDLKILLAGQ